MAQRIEVKQRPAGDALYVNGEQVQAAPDNRRIKDANVLTVPKGGTLIATWSQESENADDPKQQFSAIRMPGKKDWVTYQENYHITLGFGQFDPTKDGPKVPEKLEAASDSGLCLVQFKTRLVKDIQQDLKRLGVEIVQYVPHNSYIVKRNPKIEPILKERAYVRWCSPYHAAFKLPTAKIADEVVNRPDQRSKYNLLATTPDEKNALEGRVRATGARIVSGSGSTGRILVVEATNAQLNDILRVDSVIAAEPWSPIEKDMDNVRVLTGADAIAEPVEDPDGNDRDSLGTDETSSRFKGLGVRGHIIEGVHRMHPDFAEDDDRKAPMAVDNAGADSHGTATYGIVFGAGIGSESARGLLPKGQGLYTNFSDGNQGQRGTLVKKLIEKHRVMFQTASWGTGLTTQYGIKSQELDEIIFEHDIPITQSQSNTGNRESRPQAWAKNVISVGGVFHKDDQLRSNDRWNGSAMVNPASIGPADDDRVKPDLCACYDRIRTTKDTSGYRQFGGTSGATPIVAGCVGLAIEMWTDGVFGNELPVPGGSRFENRPHAATVKALLIASAKQYPFEGEDHDLARVHQGWGFPDVKRLYDYRDKCFVINEDVRIEVLDDHEVNITVGQNEPIIKVTLVYSDPAAKAGIPSGVPHRVNDLDLKVTSPTGVAYWGNHGLRDRPWSKPGGEPNRIDTVENVFLENPTAGKWTVQVIARDLAQDGHPESPDTIDADFALVILGGVKQ